MTIGTAVDPDGSARVDQRCCRDTSVDHRRYLWIVEAVGLDRGAVGGNRYVAVVRSHTAALIEPIDRS